MQKPKLYIDESGIIRETHTDLIISAEIAYYAAAERKRLAGDKKMPLLVQFSGMFTSTADLKDTDLDVITANISVMAFYITNRDLEGRMFLWGGLGIGSVSNTATNGLKKNSTNQRFTLTI